MELPDSTSRFASIAVRSYYAMLRPMTSIDAKSSLHSFRFPALKILQVFAVHGRPCAVDSRGHFCRYPVPTPCCAVIPGPPVDKINQVLTEAFNTVVARL
jgi:hypothetical protein